MVNAQSIDSDIVFEDDVIRAFLAAEIDSDRQFERYRPLFDKYRVDRDILFSATNQALRKKFLSEARGWPDKLLFVHFPSDVKWFRASFESKDLAKFRYINYSYWNELSSGTREPLRAADTVREGEEVFGTPNDGFLKIARLTTQGEVFPPIILLRCSDDSYVIVEGHARVTGFALAGKIPQGQGFIVGMSEGNDKWAEERKD
ncbi:MAG TPA: hypothetical protein VFQ70_02070 [Candidatus Saccharimonadaceae bacterium]|nr:hypothetical protein [Candidatus Saccharimonadaceae bacterium]